VNEPAVKRSDTPQIEAEDRDAGERMRKIDVSSAYCC